MPRIVVVGTEAQAAEGARAALRGVDGWEIVEGRAADAGDAWVLVGDDIAVRAASGGSARLSVDAGPERLRAAVAAALEGLSVREAAWATPVPEHEPLTAREIEVFELLGKGLSNREIGGVLGISSHTAKYHVAQILAKVGASTRAEAVHAGLRAGLIGL